MCSPQTGQKNDLVSGARPNNKGSARAAPPNANIGSFGLKSSLIRARLQGSSSLEATHIDVHEGHFGEGVRPIAFVGVRRKKLQVFFKKVHF